MTSSNPFKHFIMHLVKYELSYLFAARTGHCF